VTRSEWGWITVCWLSLIAALGFQELAFQGSNWWAVPSFFFFLLAMFCLASGPQQ